MSDIYPITLTRYNDLDEAGLIDANQTYQIYSTEEDIAQELIRTRKALDVATGAIDEILYLDSGKFIQEPAEMWKIAKSAKDKITALEQKDVK